MVCLIRVESTHAKDHKPMTSAITRLYRSMVIAINFIVNRPPNQRKIQLILYWAHKSIESQCGRTDNQLPAVLASKTIHKHSDPL